MTRSDEKEPKVKEITTVVKVIRIGTYMLEAHDCKLDSVVIGGVWDCGYPLFQKVGCFVCLGASCCPLTKRKTPTSHRGAQRKRPD
jgi:hypothetical protein